ncbi:MAG: alpha/beta fold hydrolase [Ramlibacter sp.]
MNDSTLSTFTASDGDNWPCRNGRWTTTSRCGAVVIVHNLGEHVGRYDHVAQFLNAWGFAVRGYDQYGHGESGGVRGALPDDDRLLEDLADVVDATRLRLPDGKPLVLLGHSMGGLVAGHFVALKRRPVDALVLAIASTRSRKSTWCKSCCWPWCRVWRPTSPWATGWTPASFATQQWSRLTSATRRCAVTASRAGWRSSLPTVASHRGRAPHWTVPTLLMYAGADKLVNPAGARALPRRRRRCGDVLLRRALPRAVQRAGPGAGVRPAQALAGAEVPAPLRPGYKPNQAATRADAAQELLFL